MDRPHGHRVLRSLRRALRHFHGDGLRLASEPFAPKHIIVNKTLFASYCCNFFVAGAMLVTVFHVSLYLQAVQGMNAAQVGLALLPSVIGGVLGSLLSGLLMQATGKYHTLSITVFLMMLAGSSLIASVTGPWKYTFAGLAVGLAANNFGGGAGITTTLIALIANAGPEDQAVATAVSYLFRTLGSVVGLSVGTTLFQDTLRKRLHERLSGADVDKIIIRVRESLSYLDKLEPTTRALVVESYQDGIQTALWFSVALTVMCVGWSTFIKEKPLAR
ncbi:hypothetical protein AcV5_004836 [Taiwanofungus camphoratus]|nr:hypothetical protein AcV5_004836 [Antrodia cinnamomea]